MKDTSEYYICILGVDKVLDMIIQKIMQQEQHSQAGYSGVLQGRIILPGWIFWPASGPDNPA
jgi:hypothetical protein